jgi:hypothetical protein
MTPWDTEIAYYINKRDIEPQKALTFTILRWMYHGDLRPLAAAIVDGYELDEAVLNMLAGLIREGRLNVVPKRKGRPKDPSKFSRNIVAGLAYDGHAGKSDEAFASIAKAIGRSESSVRQAVTALRKRQKQTATNKA